MKTKDALFQYCLRLADNNLILGQRLAEWSSRAPFLEEDLAITNMSLDLFGQAETLYEYAASLEGSMHADQLAFTRSERQYRNMLLVEQPNGDFACTMVRQLLYATYCLLLYESLLESNDETLKGFAAKAIKEVKYHFRHSSEWVIRLGQGTAESARRTQQALDALWRFTQDMFITTGVDEVMIDADISEDMQTYQTRWRIMVSEILHEAGLTIPVYENNITGGYAGIHTEHLGHLLCEMQYLQRAYPGATW
jgi:ring-1,2-phenylacetyl-CoA epoxidase subunit PaaC